MDDVRRDERGRFQNGTRPGPGRPPAAREKDFLRMVVATVSPEDFAIVVARALEDAKAGDATARAWLSRILVGAEPRLSTLDCEPVTAAILEEFAARFRGDAE